jgi:hypothetical protein
LGGEAAVVEVLVLVKGVEGDVSVEILRLRRMGGGAASS